MDFNSSFIDVSRELARAEGLAGQRPQLEVVEDFDVPSLRRGFEIVLVFSVLRHCPGPHAPLFFPRMAASVHRMSRLSVRRGAWFDADGVPTQSPGLQQHHVSIHLSICEHGWVSSGEAILPMLELDLDGHS